jgi:protein gp37
VLALYPPRLIQMRMVCLCADVTSYACATRDQKSGAPRFPLLRDAPRSAICFQIRTEHNQAWRKPRRIIVDSPSDLFHDDVPMDNIIKV